MSVVTTPRECNTIITNVLTILAEMQDNTNGFVKALRDPSNNTIDNYKRDNGKNNVYKFDYFPQAPSSDVKTTKQNICELTGTNQLMQKEVTVGNPLSIAVIVSDDELRDGCASRKDYFEQLIASKIVTFRNEIEKALITKSASLAGSLPAGLGVQTNNILQGTLPSISPNPYGMNKVLRIFQNAGLSGSPFLVGAGKLADYANMKEISCCSSQGMNANNMNGFNYEFSPNVEGILGTDHFFAWNAKNLQLLNVSMFKGDFERNAGKNGWLDRDVSFINTTMIDAGFGGVTYDVKWQIDGCTDTTKLLIQFYGEPVVMIPDDYFTAPKAGFNGLVDLIAA